MSANAKNSPCSVSLGIGRVAVKGKIKNSVCIEEQILSHENVQMRQ